ncbi:gmp synthase [Podospora aff. communis PSN243]|uniref:Gmp synthase n=1 Tax=Podospora aff. communis PSN243 TaxID=3040156 RepID=A0AAV9H2P7_9PEZI|nr:gmp synthase [Podospora aff. communis PSN243]
MGEINPTKPTIGMMILEADEPHPETSERKGTFAEILHRHFVDAGDAHDPPLGVASNNVFLVSERGGRIPKIEEFENYQAVLITGSIHDAHGDDPWILQLLYLLRELWTRRPDIRFSGVCFGHQVLCRLLGAEVATTPTEDWELGHSKIHLTKVGQRLFRTDESEIYLHQMHQDHVVAPPTPESSNGLLSPGTRVEVWGHSDHTKVQGVYIPGRLFTTQAHLAFNEEMVKQQIEMRVKMGSIEDLDHADMAAETAGMKHDGEVAAAAILRFFHGEDDEIA